MMESTHKQNEQRLTCEEIQLVPTLLLDPLDLLPLPFW